MSELQGLILGPWQELPDLLISLLTLNPILFPDFFMLAILGVWTLNDEEAMLLKISFYPLFLFPVRSKSDIGILGV